jgi:alkanesulfonate monooxygenase SsuD/methylene tetrahydromethanopterin reductase-like flavin-dependent oxidoreductase (luciferase family)
MTGSGVPALRYGLDISPLGDWGDPRTLAGLAALAERSGWDGVFVEDYVFHPHGVAAYDAWIALAAIAVATERVRLGPMITPLPRRRPWKVAAEAMTLDHLSGRRVILGVGSGDRASPDTRGVGEDADARRRASRLEEALAIVDALWRGEPVHHAGAHFRLDGVVLRPRPVQRPRVPIWVGGQFTRRGPRERAVRWDGACLYRAMPPDWEDLTAGDVGALRRLARDARGLDGDRFDIAVGGRARRADEDQERRYVAAIAAAGATWWHEYVEPQTPLDAVRDHIAAGPLRIDG